MLIMDRSRSVYQILISIVQLSLIWCSQADSSARPAIIPFSAPDSLSIGSRVKLLCSVSSGAAPLQLKWSRNGQPLSDLFYPNDADLSVQQLEDGLILNIKRMNSALNGNYTCQASNRYGSSSHSAALYVQGTFTF